jgi:hypothetical protein
LAVICLKTPSSDNGCDEGAEVNGALSFLSSMFKISCDR